MKHRKRLKAKQRTAKESDRAEDIKSCDEETKEIVRQIFNDIVKQTEFTFEAWRRVRIKVIHEKETLEMLEIPPDILLASAGQSVHDNIVQQVVHIQDLNKPKQKIRRDSEAHTKQLTILRRTG